VPHVSVSDAEKLTLLRIMNADPFIPMGFMNWELHEYPELTQTTRHTWTIKTAPKLKTPRYIILGMQTDRRNTMEKSASEFDHNQLTNPKLYLNGVPFPYDNINIDFNTNNFATLYYMYSRFQSSYYGTEDQPYADMDTFKRVCPLLVIDCSHQPETIKTGSVDVRLEFETKVAIPANTAAYCLILHDSVVNYTPLSSAVQIL
jgi:hypothetical protein